VDYKLPAQLISSFVGEDVDKYEQMFNEHHRAGNYKPMGYKPFRDSLGIYLDSGFDAASEFIDRVYYGKQDKLDWHGKNQLALSKLNDLMSSDARLKRAKLAYCNHNDDRFEQWFTYSMQKDYYSGSVKIVMSPHFSFEYRNRKIFVYVVPSKIRKTIHLHSLYSLGVKSLAKKNDGFIVVGLDTGDVVYDIGIERVYAKIRKTVKALCINVLDRLPNDIKKKYTAEVEDEDIEFDVS